MVRFRSLEHDVEIGLTAEQQNSDEGEAKRRKYLAGGTGNLLWFGYCVVHMFTCGRSDYRPMSLRPLAITIAIYADPTRPAAGWARCFVLASLVIGELVNSELVDG